MEKTCENRLAPQPSFSPALQRRQDYSPLVYPISGHRYHVCQKRRTADKSGAIIFRLPNFPQNDKPREIEIVEHLVVSQGFIWN